MRDWMTVKIYRPASNTPRTSGVTLRSARKGHISVSSVSCGSLNHEDTGTALFGWKIYEAGELSKIMVSVIGLPNCDKSCKDDCEHMDATDDCISNLNVVALVIVATFPE